jgi:chlorobactene glucosyltransferase
VTAALLTLLPWLALGAYMVLGLRHPRRLPLEAAGGEAPFVSIVVPARNEARVIRRCVESLADQRYPAFEILVVDDRSRDGTDEIVRTLAGERAGTVRLIEGAPLPEGWIGKPWACAQGAGEARGDLLLFTDADTWHHPELLGRAVAGLHEDGAGALTLVGRQELGSFGERLVQPHIFSLLAFRYPRMDRPVERRRWKDAIANGQYILVRSDVYRDVGGHETVRGEVVEDLRIAQELVRRGHRLVVREAEESFSTRMYTSLRELVDGWTKNLAIGARQAVRRGGSVAVPAFLVLSVGLWILPPTVLLAGALGWLVSLPALEGTGWPAALTVGQGVPPAAVAWAAAACLLSVAAWSAVYRRFAVSRGYGLLYPAAAAVVWFIALRSWLRGTRRIEWKGRRYGR